jgi:2-polyprenyl-3-methyl-5-hydroxy-6-metoxy-1,4-benzoquinol methylase
MSEYHKFVFDTNNRLFVGNFDEMYKQESKVGFDSWHQEDNRQLNRKIAFSILESYNFNTIIDLGCGKGTVTHLLKKNNNSVIGVDVSDTALEIAKSRFPDIVFKNFDINQINEIEIFFGQNDLKVDLIFSAELFSYLSNYKKVLASLSKKCKYLMITLYLPENPIGFVKSQNELELAISKHYNIIEFVQLKKSRFSIVFAESK